MDLCFAAWCPLCLAGCVPYRLHIAWIEHMSYHIAGDIFHTYHSYHHKICLVLYPVQKKSKTTICIMFSQSNHCLMVLKPRIQSFLWWNPKFSPQISQLDTSWSNFPRPGKCCCRPRLLGGHGISWSHGWCVRVIFCHVDIPLKQLEETHTHRPLWYIYIYIYCIYIYILYMYCIYTVYILYIYIYTYTVYIHIHTLGMYPFGIKFLLSHSVKSAKHPARKSSSNERTMWGSIASSTSSLSLPDSSLAATHLEKKTTAEVFGVKILHQNVAKLGLMMMMMMMMMMPFLEI